MTKEIVILSIFKSIFRNIHWKGKTNFKEKYCQQQIPARQPFQVIFWVGFWRELEKFKNSARDVMALITVLLAMGDDYIQQIPTILLQLTFVTCEHKFQAVWSNYFIKHKPLIFYLFLFSPSGLSNRIVLYLKKTPSNYTYLLNPN